jgi:hypothetical protein
LASLSEGKSQGWKKNQTEKTARTQAHQGIGSPGRARSGKADAQRNRGTDRHVGGCRRARLLMLARGCAERGPDLCLERLPLDEIGRERLRALTKSRLGIGGRRAVGAVDSMRQRIKPVCYP